MIVIIIILITIINASLEGNMTLKYLVFEWSK